MFVNIINIIAGWFGYKFVNIEDEMLLAQYDAMKKQHDARLELENCAMALQMYTHLDKEYPEVYAAYINALIRVDDLS